jgi:tRNA G10  N-methylase Trm11
MLNNSSPGQSVYEPFVGSGTTLIAAETIGRACFAIELEPRYVDVAIRRWQAFTGKSATLLADGRSFEAIATDRVPGEPKGETKAPSPEAAPEAEARRKAGGNARPKT